jgi:hypothetical protein
MRCAALVLSVALALPPANRLAFVQAVTVPLFQCDVASAPTQLTLCPVVARQIAHTPIPPAFHGAVQAAARHLRTVSAHCAWVLRAEALHFLRTSQAVYRPALRCEGAVATWTTRFYALR